MPRRVLVIGGGHAGAQLCASLARAPDIAVTLVSEEPHLPYHRPPLSKTFPAEGGIEAAEIRPASFYESSGVELLLAHRALRIDLSAKEVLLAHGEAHKTCRYDELVLALGAQAREVPALARGTPGVHYIRTLRDARGLLDALRGASIRRVAVVGGGFIGLEAGSALLARGLAVSLLEAGPRLLGRAASPQLADWLLQAHRASRLDVRLACPLIDAHALAGGRVALQTPSELVTADLVLVGAGSTPCTALAREAGLACGESGIEVDEWLRASDPHVSAIGDCAWFPAPGGGRLRLESVYNAVEQAKALAARLCGKPVAYAPAPWFWSDQGRLRLQMAGLYHPRCRTEPVMATADGIVLHHFDGEDLVAAEAVNAPREYMQARRRIEARATAPQGSTSG